MSRKVILDVDTGTDDAVAIMFAACHPDIDLIGITTGLLVLVLCSAKLAELALRARGGELPRVPEALPRVAPLRAASLTAVVVGTWIALLAIGASELSPLERPLRKQIAVEPRQDTAPQPAAQPPAGEQDDLSSPPAATETPTASGRGDATGKPRDSSRSATSGR